MSDIKIPSESVFKEAILDLDEPVLFKEIANITESSFKQLKLKNLIELFGDTSLPFRSGFNLKTLKPQWDVSCPVKLMTLKQFVEKIDKTNGESEEWYYFDYKYIHEWFKDKPEILNTDYWKPFGFDNSGKDSTLWIGSNGAHTNCHQDSYGCNLIAQIHGRKQWLLFPPESGNILGQIRVPYEESTIYCKLNLFCPSKEAEKAILKINRCILVTLQPGEILFVPKGWWHYVESLDLSVSVNTWLPLLSDSRSRLKEAVVKLIVNRLGTAELPSAEELDQSLQSSVEMVKKCVRDWNELNKQSQKLTEKKFKKVHWNVQDLAEAYPDVIIKLHDLANEDLKKLLKEKRQRFRDINENKERSYDNFNDSNSNNILQNIVSIVCHDDVIEKIVRKLSD